MKHLSLTFAILFGWPAAVCTATQFFGPTPYLSSADSPFDLSSLGESFFLEDFEDGLLNTPGVTNINGSVRGPSGLTDSVDADDGVIDGSGNGGHDFLVRPGSLSVTFEFDDVVLGSFPTFVGIVSTDGYGQNGFPASTVEFFDPSGELIGTLDDPIQNFNVGTTDDDRFLGIFHPEGVSKIRISHAGGGNIGLEIDHLQYGVPEPSTLALAILGIASLLAFGWCRRREQSVDNRVRQTLVRDVPRL